MKFNPPPPQLFSTPLHLNVSNSLSLPQMGEHVQRQKLSDEKNKYLEVEQSSRFTFGGSIGFLGCKIKWSLDAYLRIVFRFSHAIYYPNMFFIPGVLMLYLLSDNVCNI